jgi:hypothetical protein
MDWTLCVCHPSNLHAVMPSLAWLFYRFCRLQHPLLRSVSILLQILKKRGPNSKVASSNPLPQSPSPTSESPQNPNTEWETKLYSIISSTTIFPEKSSRSIYVINISWKKIQTSCLFSMDLIQLIWLIQSST